MHAPVIDIDLTIELEVRLRPLMGEFHFADKDAVKGMLGLAGNIWPASISKDHDLANEGAIYLPLGHYDHIVGAFFDHPPGGARAAAVEGSTVHTSQPEPRRWTGKRPNDAFTRFLDTEIAAIHRSHARIAVALSEAATTLKTT